MRMYNDGLINGNEYDWSSIWDLILADLVTGTSDKYWISLQTYMKWSDIDTDSNPVELVKEVTEMIENNPLEKGKDWGEYGMFWQGIRRWRELGQRRDRLGMGRRGWSGRRSGPGRDGCGGIGSHPWLWHSFRGKELVRQGSDRSGWALRADQSPSRWCCDLLEMDGCGETENAGVQ